MPVKNKRLGTLDKWLRVQEAARSSRPAAASSARETPARLPGRLSQLQRALLLAALETAGQDKPQGARILAERAWGKRAITRRGAVKPAALVSLARARRTLYRKGLIHFWTGGRLALTGQGEKTARGLMLMPVDINNKKRGRK